MEYSSFHKVMMDALALEVNGDTAGEDDEATLDDPSQEARQLLEDLAMHDHADAAAVVGQLRAEQRQRDIDVGGVE
jgi:hypothetical protein